MTAAAAAGVVAVVVLLVLAFAVVLVVPVALRLVGLLFLALAVLRRLLRGGALLEAGRDRLRRPGLSALAARRELDARLLRHGANAHSCPDLARLENGDAGLGGRRHRPAPSLADQPGLPLGRPRRGRRARAPGTPA